MNGPPSRNVPLAGDDVTGRALVVPGGRLALEPVGVLVGRHETAARRRDCVQIAGPQHLRAGIAGVPPVDEVVAGAELRRVGHRVRDRVEAGEGAVALAGRRLADREAQGLEWRDRDGPHRLDDHVARLHPVRWPCHQSDQRPWKSFRRLRAVSSLEQQVDLSARRVAEVTDPDEARRPGGIAGILEAHERIVHEGDASAPFRVEELCPGQLLRPLSNDVLVVAEGVEVERARHAGAEARLRPHRQTGLLVRPLNDQPLQLGWSSRGTLPPAGAFGVEIQPAKGRVTLPVGAAPISRPQLAELEQGADLVPRA